MSFEDDCVDCWDAQRAHVWQSEWTTWANEDVIGEHVRIVGHVDYRENPTSSLSATVGRLSFGHGEQSIDDTASSDDVTDHSSRP